MLLPDKFHPIIYLFFFKKALGYRDFDEGVSSTVEYLKYLKERNVPVLCCNMDVTLEPDMKDLYQKSAIFNISGRLVGVIGYIGTDADVRQTVSIRILSD